MAEAGGQDLDSSSLFRILVATDIHLGYGEKNEERAEDSFRSFAELLDIGLEQGVDLVVLGGDLFHENKPSRAAEIKCLQILRERVLGDRPVQVEYLSDPEVDFGHCNSKCVNYENPNLNIALPIFSIHGNHDDPSGHGGHSCLDLIHEAGMVNYWGKVTDLKHIKVRPVLLRKGPVQVALYGLSHVKDERLHRLFRENKVEFELPLAEEGREWFHILVLHQNRAKRGPTSYIPESFIPDFFHLVIWGHEHDCRIQPEASDKDFFITQPGSPVATSLCEGEAIQKAVGVLNIRSDTKFKMDVIPLRTVRPLIFRSVALSDLKVDLTEPDPKKLALDVERHLRYEVEEMLGEVEEKRTGHPGQPCKPLLRLRVEFNDEAEMINPSRFGNNYIDQVSNPAEILLFKKAKFTRSSTKDEKVDLDAIDMLGDDITMDDLVEEYFNNLEDETKQMSVLSVKRMGAAVKSFINKDDKQAVEYLVTRQRKKFFEHIVEMEDEGEEAMEAFLLSQRSKTDKDAQEEEREAVRELEDPGRQKRGGGGVSGRERVDDWFDVEASGDVHRMSDSDVEVETENLPVRGRGRGRGTGRGRAAKPTKAPVVAKPRARAAPTSPVKGRGGRGGRGGGQSTIAAAFAKSQASQSQSQRSSRMASQNRKQMFESDDSD